MNDIYIENIKNERHKLRKSSRRKLLIFTCLIALVSGSAMGFIIRFSHILIDLDTDAEHEDKIEMRISEFQFTQSQYDYMMDFSGIIEKIHPSVVGIITTPRSNLWEVFDVGAEGAGFASGIIFEETEDEVFIVTNYHVIAGVSNVGISFLENVEVQARIIGSEEEGDLAVLSVDKDSLRLLGIEEVYIPIFGDSDELQVGERVVTIGNMCGEGNTATIGIISAKDKEIVVDETTKLTVIQTDAIIHLGNSGGPLINTRGEIIGINTAKSHSFSFSIPSNIMKPIIYSLIEDEEKGE